jgi:hypothetical protein
MWMMSCSLIFLFLSYSGSWKLSNEKLTRPRLRVPRQRHRHMGPHLGDIGNRRAKTTTDRIGRLADYRRPIWNSANHRPRQASRKMKTTSVQNEAIQFRDFTGPPRMLRRSTIPVAPLP